MTTLPSITSPFVIEDINLFLHPVTSLLSGPSPRCGVGVRRPLITPRPQPGPRQGRARPAHLRGAVRPPPASVRSRSNKGSASQRIISSLNDRKQLIFSATQHQLPPRRAGPAASARALCSQLRLISRLAAGQARVPALAQARSGSGSPPHAVTSRSAGPGQGGESRPGPSVGPPSVSQ